MQHPRPGRAVPVIAASLLLGLIAWPACNVGDAPAAREGATQGDVATAEPSRGNPGPVAPEAGVTTAASEDRGAKAVPAASPRATGERPLPAFEGVTLSGEPLSISSFIGKRLVLFFFNPDVDEAGVVARAVAEIARERGRHNFEVVGIGVGSSRPKIRALRDDLGLDFPILDDSSGRITRRLGLRSPVTLIGVDPEGYLGFGLSQFDTSLDDASGVVEDRLRESLRLPSREPARAGAFGARPALPTFEATRLEGGDDFSSSELAGRPAIVMFFLHTCPHCHAALAFLKEELPKIPEEKRPLLVGVSVLDRPSAVRQQLAELDLDFFPVVLDPGSVVQRAMGTTGSVPDLSFVDAKGRIVHRVRGWHKRDAALSRMVIAKIAGERIPMLLNPKGYTGDDACGVCHEIEHESWLYTKHASAFDTLVTHGEDRNVECVGCHVVGFDEPGGYTIASPPVHLENVSCESCHGRGGPHLSKGFVSGGDYQKVCVGCHNPKHSLGFEYASFRPRISHTAIAAMSSEQRAALGSAARPGKLLSKSADYVGSEACRECHGAEFSTWAAGPHAQASKTLEKGGASDNAECLSCHTTGYDLPGGFPASASPADQVDLARVGCESCHGPGAAHVAAGATRIGTILSLGDKCDSCVILQICGGCHDDANDPGFEFEVVEKIERQRHGTIEAGTGRPLRSVGVGLDPGGRRGRAETAAGRLLAHLHAGGA